MLANGNHLIGKIVNLNHENSISENFLGEERNFPGFGTFGPSSWEISFLTSKIFGNIIFPNYILNRYLDELRNILLITQIRVLDKS